MTSSPTALNKQRRLEETGQRLGLGLGLWLWLGLGLGLGLRSTYTDSHKSRCCNSSLQLVTEQSSRGAFKRRQ